MIIWKGTKEEFEIHLRKVNYYHPTIEFEYLISKTETNFFDMAVFKFGNPLRTKLYMNLTDEESNLKSKSEQPLFTKNSIAYSQDLRL